MLTVTNNTKRPSFHGLTSRLAKNMHKPGDIIKLYEKEKTRTNGIVGTIPPEWTALIPYRKRRAAVKNILSAFSAAGRDSRLSSSSNLKKIFLPVEQALKKSGVIKSAEDFGVKYLDNGAYGEAYKVSVNKQSYVMKSFYSFLDLNDKNLDGNFVEQAAALFINKYYPNKNWAKFYFGDLQAGTMFSKFSGYENLYRGKNAHIEESGLIPDADHFARYNIKGGRCIDFGHFGFYEQALNKTCRYVCKIAMRSPKEVIKLLKKTLSWKESQLVNDRIHGCVLALQYMDTAAKNKILPMLMPIITEKNAISLSESFSIIPPARRDAVFDKIISFENHQADINIARRLTLFTKPERPFGILAARESKEINRVLAKYLYTLEPESRIMYFERFLAFNDEELNKALAGSLHSLPKGVQAKYMLRLLEDEKMFNPVLSNLPCLSKGAFKALNEWISQKGIF